MNITLSTAFQEELLTNSWRRCWDNVFHVDNDLLRDTVIWRYSEPIREYHNISHLIGCLLEFKAVRKLATNPESVELSLWFHDAIYNIHSSTNESDSANLLRGSIFSSVPDVLTKQHEKTATYCANLILATMHNVTPRTADAKLICDIDLITLGADETTFNEYCDKIRREYAKIEDEKYYPERLKILSLFIDKDCIFYTKYFHGKYEKTARKNIKNEIHRLKGVIKAL